MNAQSLYNRLSHFPSRLSALIAGLSDDDARWRPDDGAWSILEIVRHLEDEEVEDFRTRVRMTLEDPTEPWPPIDPPAAAIERRYNDDDLQQSLKRFVVNRTDSLTWLEPRLNDIAARANQAYNHPSFGEITLGDVFTGWVAHDQLHIRQIARRLYQLTARDAGKFSTRYAGDW